MPVFLILLDRGEELKLLTVHLFQIDGELERVEAEVAGVDQSSAEELESEIDRLSRHPLLHSRHYILIELAHSLVFAYSQQPAASLTRPNLERKVQLCWQVSRPDCWCGSLHCTRRFWRFWVRSTLASPLGAVNSLTSSPALFCR